MKSIIFHTMKTIGKSTSALKFTTNHNDGAMRDVLVGYLSPPLTLVFGRVNCLWNSAHPISTFENVHGKPLRV